MSKGNAKKDKKGKQKPQPASVSATLAGSEAVAEPRAKMSRKELENELERLQVELVKM